MKQSRKPSILPVIPWMIANVLALADVILRLAKPPVIPETLIVPVAVVLLLTAATGYQMHRYQKRQGAGVPPSDESAPEDPSEAAKG